MGDFAIDFEGSSHIARFSLVLALYVATSLLPVCAIMYASYFLLTLPMRRTERARLFLDLLAVGLREGRAPERAVLDASNSREPALGVRFHLLAAYLEKGLRLGEALDKVPRLLPPQVNAMLKAGERIGDIARVLPACRRLLGDGVSQVRGAINYVILLAFVVTPFSIVVPLMISLFVLPKFREVFAGISAEPLPPFTLFMLSENRTLILIEVVMLAAAWLIVLFYIGGPRLSRWTRGALPNVCDRVQLLLPWRRRRLQRDFSAMLAVLLDAGVTEVEAVQWAADCTVNGVMQRRARKVCGLLQSGVKLPVAIRAADDSGELHWRLSNALNRGRGFLQALSGWHESLDAKAFQSEQAAAQTSSAVLALLNGALVGALVIAIFMGLVHLIHEAVLW